MGRTKSSKKGGGKNINRPLMPRVRLNRELGWKIDNLTAIKVQNQVINSGLTFHRVDLLNDRKTAA